MAMYFECLAAFGRRPGVSPSPGRQLVVSLTSYPERLAVVHLTVESILRQELKPTAIVLWLSEDEIAPSDVPANLRRQQERGLDIRFVPGNYRSYKKLIYAAQHYPDAVIVTADDDVCYPKHWLRDLWAASQESPEKIGRAHV